MYLNERQFDDKAIESLRVFDAEKHKMIYPSTPSNWPISARPPIIPGEYPPAVLKAGLMPDMHRPGGTLLRRVPGAGVV